MKLTFYGGAKSVTGANYLLETETAEGTRRVLVDCGLRQGSYYAEHENFEPFPYDPKTVDAVFITHAHIDHVGRLPKLVKDGFQGTIYSTPATKDFAELLLLDSEHILGKEAARENHDPLYGVEDVAHLMQLWQTKEYHTRFQAHGVLAEFLNAGHVLGSAIVRLESEDKVVIFSGDLGNWPAPILKQTEKIDHADYCVIESAYGDRVHEGFTERKESLEDAIEDTVRRGGTLIIPVFALERTQEILYHLNDLFEKGRVPKVPVFLDSPLAIKLTAIYKKYEQDFNKETQALVRSGDDILNFPGLQLTLTTEQSKDINNVAPPKIILAGSGMSQGGRILHHESHYLPDSNAMILFVGFQSRGSLGRQILEGASQVRINGHMVPVHCERREIGAYSAHADQPRLLEWLSAMRGTVKKVFVVQGEEEASTKLAEKARDELAIDAIVPDDGQTVVL